MESTLYNANHYELDLHFDRSDEGLSSHVRRSPAGQGTARFVLPFARRDLEKIWETLRAVQAAGKATAPQRVMIQDAGRQLFEAAFAGEVLGCLRASFDQTDFDQAPLRLHLDLSATPELEALPWEYLYNSERSEFAALTPESPSVRYTSLQHRILPGQVVKPLRLLVVASGPSSYPRVDVDREWLNLLDSVDFLGAAGKMVVERLQKPTLLDLQRKLRQGEFHLIHFIGHGVMDKATGEGQLVLEDEMGRARLVGGQHLGALMRDHYALRGIVLTGPTHTGVGTEYGALLDVARSLVRRGVAAVIAPQLRVSRPAWLAFCQTLYRGLAEMQPIDAVVVEGRRAMAEKAEDLGWGAPVLFGRVADGLLFDDGSLPKIAQSEAVQAGVTSRLNSMRIRTASRELMERWARDLPDLPKPGDSGRRR
jgi:hypothetical protein